MTKKEEDFDQEYDEYIKNAVETGEYFQDARSWFFRQYISSITDRSFLLVLFVLGVIVSFNLVGMISSVLPLSEEVPIILKEKNAAELFPVIKKLEGSGNTKGTDEVISQFLITEYIKERESYDYSRDAINRYKEKAEKIKTLSSSQVYLSFQEAMSTSNASSPVKYFNKPVLSTVEVESFEFVKKPIRNNLDKIASFLKPNVMPTQARVKIVITTKAGTKTLTNSRNIDVKFKFNGVQKENEKFLPLNFTVTGYNYYK